MIIFIQYLVVLLANVVLIALNKKSSLVYYLSALFITLYSAGLQQGHDYQNYLAAYTNNDVLHTYSIGFGFLESIAIWFHLDFKVFYAISIMLSSVLIFTVVKKSKVEFHSFIVIYMLYYVFSSVQLKNQIGLSFFLLGIYFLLNRSGIKGIVLFSVFTLIAASFHLIFLSYLIFILVSFRRLQKPIKALACFSVILAVVSIALRDFNVVKNVGSFFLSILGEERYQNYLVSTTRFGALPTIFVALLMVFLSYCNQKRFDSNRADTNGRALSDQKLFNVSLLSLAFIPLVVINVTFYRIIRNVSLVVILFASYFWPRTTIIEKRYQFTYRICSLLIVVLFLYFDFILKGYSDTFFSDHFGKNLFILG